MRQLEPKLKWPNVTGAVEAKFAVESKATHMGPEAELKTADAVEAAAKEELMLQIVVRGYGAGDC